MTTSETQPPHGWVTAALSEAARLRRDRIDPAVVPNAKYVGLEHVEAHSMRVLGYGRATDVKSTKALFSAGDVLYGKLRPYLNKVARPNFDGICSTDFLVFGSSPALDRGYLAYYLNQLWVADRSHRMSSGVELPRVNWKALSQLRITFPRRKEDQQAIVDWLERAGDCRVRAMSRLMDARRLIGRFRHSILASACSGRLTSEWRETHPGLSGLDLLRELADLRRRVSPKGSEPLGVAEKDLPPIPPSWTWASVDSVSKVVVDGVHKTPTYLEEGVPFVTVRNLTQSRDLTFEGCRFISRADHEAFRVRANPQRGDLLISKDGTIGVTRAIRTDREFSIFVSVALVKPVNYEMTDYLELALQSPQVQRQMVGVGSGLTHLVLRELKADGIPLPPLDEQREIVKRASRLLKAADRLLLQIAAVSDRITQSSQAILAKALGGALSSDQTTRVESTSSAPA